MNEYKSWKEYAKPHSLATTLPNLIKAYEKLKGCSPAIVEDQVQIDAVWTDTSDEEPLCEPKQSKHNVEALANTLQDRTADLDITGELDDDEALKNDWADFCPTPDCALESFIQKFDKQDNMADMQVAGVALKEDDKDDEVQCLSGDPCLKEPDDGDVVTSLDGLTNTQLLFGHGSYAGLTLSQCFETPAKGNIAQEMLPPTPPPAVHVDAPKAIDSLVDGVLQPYNNSDVEDQWAFISDDVSSAAMGLCNLSQIPDINMPDDLEHQCGSFNNLFISQIL
ncbi:unnamed protein product [Calypogeia fissa]